MVSQEPSRIKATLARNIRAARDIHGLTQRQLAVKLDCEPQLVSKWERAQHIPSQQHLQALADALERHVAWFYTDHDAADDEVAA